MNIVNQALLQRFLHKEIAFDFKGMPEATAAFLAELDAHGVRWQSGAPAGSFIPKGIWGTVLFLEPSNKLSIWIPANIKKLGIEILIIDAVMQEDYVDALSLL